MRYRDEGNNSTKKEESQNKSVVTGYFGTAGTGVGVDLCGEPLIPAMLILMLMIT